MAPIPRRRRRSDPGIGRPAQRRRVGSVSTAAASNRMVKRVRSNRSMVRMAGRSGSSNAAFVSKRMNSKKVQHAKSKNVKISKKFRKAVQKALVDEGEGFYRKVHFVRIPRPNSDLQKVESLGMFFSPIRMAEAMQVLFAEQVPVEIPVPGSLVYPNLETTELYVKKSWMTAEVKNNGQRTLYITFWQCKPKTVDNANPAIEDWSEGLIQMFANGTNPRNNTIATLHNDPRLCAQFDHYWSVEKQTVTLTPGQTYKYTMNGPSDFNLDFKKMFHKTAAPLPTISNNQKFGRELMISYYADVVQDQGGNVGRKYTGSDGFGGLSVQYDEFFVLKRPDTAGFKYPASTAAGQIQNLNFRKDVRVIEVFSQATSGLVVDVLEENPISAVIDPVD